GVSEAVIYRRFGSKAELFDAAVVEPIHEFVVSWTAQWTRDNLNPTSGEEVIDSYVSTLYDAFDKNRDLVLAYISAMRFEPTVRRRKSEESVISRQLREMDDWAMKTGEQLKFHDLDFPVTLRCS